MSDEEWKAATHAADRAVCTVKELGGQLSGSMVSETASGILEEFVGPRMIQLYKSISWHLTIS